MIQSIPDTSNLLYQIIIILILAGGASYFLIRLIKTMTSLHLGMLIGLMHCLGVLLWDIFIQHILLKTEPAAMMGWMLFVLLDLPVVLILKVIGFPGAWNSQFIIFGIFGSLQYFLIGYVVGLLIQKGSKSSSIHK